MFMDWSTAVPIIVAQATAILVALLAWIQSNRALKESRRQHALSETQARALHDLDAVRNLLDAAALKLQQLSIAAIGVDRDVSSEQLQTFRDTTMGLEELASRLEIRFGREHEVVDAFRCAESEAFELLWYSEARGNALRPGTKGRKTNAFEIGMAIDHYRQLFVSDAARWAGARLTSPTVVTSE